MQTKNERLKQANIDKISLFLNKKYNKVFKDKGFTIDILKQEISKLLLGKDMKSFNYNENIKKIEKTILKKISNYGEIKYEPIYMAKIDDLLNYNHNNSHEANKKIIKENKPIQNKEEIKAPKTTNDRIIKSAIPPHQNINLNAEKRKEIPYPTEKMERLKEREKNKWAIQINKEHEQYLKDQEKLKKSLLEKKLKQREILEQQIKEKKEKEQKMRQEDFQTNLASFYFGNIIPNNKQNNIIYNNKNEKIKRPLSSKPLNTRKKEEKEEIEYQKKIEENLKKYEKEENIKKKTLREKYKEIEKENYENAIKKKQKIMQEKELEKNEKNDFNNFIDEDNNRTLQLIKMKQKNTVDLNKINQNMKHQIAINNYEENKYKRESELEQKKYIDEELLQKEKKQKLINDYKKGLDEQIKEKEKLKERINKDKIDENKDFLNLNIQLQNEKNLREKQKYEKINNYKKELDEQIEKNKKYKKNNEFL